MRVAIFHDYFGAIGGGERVALTLARALGATIYTTDVNRTSVERLGFGDVRLESLGALIQRVPLKQVHASLRFALARADAEVYVLSGNWAVYAGRRHHPNVTYCYTPVRAFYDLREQVLLRQEGAIRRGLARAWIAGHGAADRIAWSQADRVIAISENTRRRIATYLGRDAFIVYPPTDVARYRFEAVGDFWLSVNRLYPEKRLEIQFEAFRRLPRERLVVIGGYAHGDHAERYVGTLNPPSNVEMRGEVDESELARLYSRCRGLICTAQDEDFGMTPVEAMASGKFVLAADEGGFRETIIPGETGLLLPPTPEAFARAIASVTAEDLERRSEACRRRAMDFDISRFLAAMRAVLEDAASGDASRKPTLLATPPYRRAPP